MQFALRSASARVRSVMGLLLKRPESLAAALPGQAPAAAAALGAAALIYSYSCLTNKRCCI